MNPTAHIAIDGTGTTALYRKNKVLINYCFVYKLVNLLPASAKIYILGPNASPLSAADVIQRALDELDRLYKAGHRSFLLSGWSRGGYGCIELANIVHENKDRYRGVEFPVMLLFDAVNRSISPFDKDKIPGNVHVCYHARRDPSCKSRAYMGGTGYKAASNVNLQIQYFHCSHAALGGLPWDQAAEEGLGVAGVTVDFVSSVISTDVNVYNKAVGRPAASHYGVTDYLGELFAKNQNALKYIGFGYNLDDPALKQKRGSPTKISLETDIAESRRVGGWMWANLIEIGLISPSLASARMPSLTHPSVEPIVAIG